MSVKITSFVPQVIDAQKKGTEQEALKTAIRVVTEAKSLAPVDLGQLKGSLMWKSQNAEGLNTEGPKLAVQAKKNSIIVGTSVLHGIYQEFGTRKMPAQPYFRPAIAIVVNGAGVLSAVAKAMADTVLQRMRGL